MMLKVLLSDLQPVTHAHTHTLCIHLRPSYVTDTLWVGDRYSQLLVGTSPTVAGVAFFVGGL